ncbi:hypothetical protein CRENBAI_017369 [Crenichthys baileyi]|uniref:Uncharacterized protein n=1 Tax=Crenichthys baileyi TaxID=28760 RepID=A0AAV9S4A9_9TELE
MQGHTLYHPPKCFFMSPIKPSMYMALSRVFTREDIEVTNCGFTERIGQVEFYPEQLVAYRTRTTSTQAPGPYVGLWENQIVSITAAKSKIHHYTAEVQQLTKSCGYKGGRDLLIRATRPHVQMA